MREDLLLMVPPRLSTPRGQWTHSERAIPPPLQMPQFHDDLFSAIEWRILMTAYRQGKLDL